MREGSLLGTPQTPAGRLRPLHPCFMSGCQFVFALAGCCKAAFPLMIQTFLATMAAQSAAIVAKKSGEERSDEQSAQGNTPAVLPLML